MTVSTESTGRVEYAGNGATLVFAYAFKIFADADLVVTLVSTAGTGTVQVLGSDYTVSGAGNAGGGNVTMAVAPASGATLVIERQLDATQETDWTDTDSFQPSTVEDAVDKLTMLVQEDRRDTTRSMRLPTTAVGDVSVELPNPEASKYLAWNADADAIINAAGSAGSDDVPVSTFMATVLDDETAAAARTTLGIVPVSTFMATVLDDETAAAARTTLGLAIGSDVQAYHANLAALAGLTLAADKLTYATGAGALELADLTAAGRALLDDASGTVQRGTLGLQNGGELTMASGAITPTALSHTVDTEGDAVSDDLDTITATNAAAGDIITLRAVSDARYVYLTTAGNIGCPALLREEVPLRLLWDGTKWWPVDSCVLIDDLTASNSASLSFTKGIGSSAFYCYDFHLEYVRPVSTSFLGFNISVDAGANWRNTSGDYYRATIGRDSAGNVIGSGSKTETFVSVHPYDLPTTTGVSGVLRLHDPFGTSLQLFDWLLAVAADNTGAELVHISGSAQYRGTSEAITGVRFKMNSGNVTAGRIYCYGRRKP